MKTTLHLISGQKDVYRRACNSTFKANVVPPNCLLNYLSDTAIKNHPKPCGFCTVRRWGWGGGRQQLWQPVLEVVPGRAQGQRSVGPTQDGQGRP